MNGVMLISEFALGLFGLDDGLGAVVLAVCHDYPPAAPPRSFRSVMRPMSSMPARCS